MNQQILNQAFQLVFVSSSPIEPFQIYFRLGSIADANFFAPSHSLSNWDTKALSMKKENSLKLALDL